MGFAELAGGLGVNFFHDAIELRQGLKSCFEGDGGDGLVAVEQEIMGVMSAKGAHVFTEGQAGGMVKCPREVAGGDLAALSDILETEVFAESVFANEADGLFDERGEGGGMYVLTGSELMDDLLDGEVEQMEAGAEGRDGDDV